MADHHHGEGDDPKKDQESKKTNQGYALVRHAAADMSEAGKHEICDVVTSLIEKHMPDIQGACKAVKVQLDKLYGSYWNVVVGEGYGFEITHQKHHVIYFFFGNNSILLWKSI